MRFDWPEYHLTRSDLRDEQGFRLKRSPWDNAEVPAFRSVAEAEEWMDAHNVRGTVREPRKY